MKASGIFMTVLLISIVLNAQRKNTDTLLKQIARGNDSIKAHLYYQLAKNYLRVDLDSCRMFANNSLEYSKSLKRPKVAGECYSVLGAAEKYEGNFDKAIEYHLKAIDIKEKGDDTMGMCISNNDIGILYKNMKRYDEAMEYYRKANSLAIAIQDPKGMSMTYSNIGTIHSALGKNDSTLHYYSKALEVAQSVKDSSATVNALSNLGEYYGTVGEYEKALSYFKQCLPIDLAFDDQYGIILDYMNIGNSLSQMKQFEEAESYLKKAEELALDSKMNKELIGVYESKFKMYRDRNNPAQALVYLEKAKLLNDSLLNEESQKQVSELNTKYKTAKKEKQIIDQNSKIERQRFWLVSSMAIILLLSLLGYGRYRRLQIQNQARVKEAVYEQQELATKRVIAAEETERQRIASELHDGVGQLMSAAKMNLNALEDELPFKDADQKLAYDRCMELLSESGKEIRIVAHNLMPNVLLKKGLSNAVREFLNKIDSKKLEVNLQAVGIHEVIDTSTETILYRVIQECVNNVIKHSGANKLDISIVKDAEGISVTVEDNGKGFDIGKISEKDGIGLQNIRTRIVYLKGSVDFDSAPGKGTLVAIFVPKA